MKQLPNHNPSPQWRSVALGLWLALGLIWLAVPGLAKDSRAAAQDEPSPPLEPAANGPNTCGFTVYDWNGAVTTANRGFPWEQPPRNNYDWTGNPDFASGTLYYRAIVKNQPQAQDMKLQLCFWQPKIGDSYNFGLENCGDQKAMVGNAADFAAWQTTVQGMWKLNGASIDWTRPRYRAGVAIKNTAGLPVSNFNGWDWNGENPDDWYPFQMRFTAVVVPPDGEFCGWEYYDAPLAVHLRDVRAAGAAAPAVPLLAALSLAGGLTVLALRRRGG